MRALVILTAPAMLGGCATFATNVEGSFSCRAPDGTCAPATAIDDAALAQIEDDGADETELFAPAGDVQPAQIGQGGLIAAAMQDPPGNGLRIVFPAHRDANGIQHARREVVIPLAPSDGVLDARLARSSDAGLIDIAQAAPPMIALTHSAQPVPDSLVNARPGKAEPDAMMVPAAATTDYDPIASIEASVAAATARRAANAPASFSGMAE